MRLTLENGPHAGHVVTLQRDHPVHLGSGADCEVRLAEAAPQHAVIKALKEEGFGIKALAPGLSVNGREVEVAALHDGDVIELAGQRIAVGKRQAAAAAKPQQIAGFRLLGELGHGGMGMVYRAEQISLRREVALKVLTRALTQDQKFVQRFVAEARAAARLGHPNVVQVFDVDHDGDVYYYAMEVMHEGSLEAWLKQHGKMPVERALQVVSDAAAGLAYAESLGIVHRDIKPDNLMLDQHGTVKIADLGLAHTDDEEEGKLHGTPHFMAPEQVLRKGADHRTDLYALGCTFYRLVTGKTPFRGQSVKDILRAQVKDEAEPANKVEPGVPAEVAAIIQKLMAKEPADRFQSANELQDALQVLLHPPHRKGLWIGLAAAAVLVAGGAIYWAVTKPKEIKHDVKFVDNPVAQELYDENARLKADLRERDGRIALLQARLSGHTGMALAAQFEQVEQQFAGSKAAIEAHGEAERVRREEQQQQAAAAQRRERATAAATALATDVQQAVQAGDFGAALQRLDVATAEDVQREPVYQDALQAQRQKLQAAVADKLAALRQPIEAARQAGDPVALAAALPPLAAALDEHSGWPQQLLPEAAQQRAFLQQCREAVPQLREAREREHWQRYESVLRADVRAQLLARDFAAAAAALQPLGGGDGDASQRAGRLQAALQLADQGAKALAAAAAQGSMQLQSADNLPHALARIDWSTGVLVLLDNQKRPAKEMSVPFADVSMQQWTELATQLQTPVAGSRECLLGCLLLAEQLRNATDYLQRLQPGDDESGTGAAGYVQGNGNVDALLRLLPAGDVAWSEGLRQELTACRLLAAGLRAMSERRNLAAASHLDQLLQEHPHSLVAAALGNAP